MKSRFGDHCVSSATDIIVVDQRPFRAGFPPYPPYPNLPSLQLHIPPKHDP